MRTVPTRTWEATDYLGTDADFDAHPDAVLKDGDARLIAAVLSDIARTSGMSKVGADIDCSRERRCQPMAIPSCATAQDRKRTGTASTFNPLAGTTIT